MNISHVTKHFLILTVCAIAASFPALSKDESIALDTSAREIAISPDFSGAEIVIFGSIDNSKQDSRSSGYYDIIIAIRGPAETVVIHRKERVAGIWVNGASRSLSRVPSFYGVLSTKPLTEITDQDTLRRFDVEFDPTSLQENRAPPTDFERALPRLKEREGMYVKAPFAVAFLSQSLFRATVRMPPQVLEGTYTAQTYLFHKGQIIASDTAVIEFKAIGLLRYLRTLASDAPFLFYWSVFIMFTGGLLILLKFVGREPLLPVLGKLIGRL